MDSSDEEDFCLGGIELPVGGTSSESLESENCSSGTLSDHAIEIKIPCYGIDGSEIDNIHTDVENNQYESDINNSTNGNHPNHYHGHADNNNLTASDHSCHNGKNTPQQGGSLGGSSLALNLNNNSPGAAHEEVISSCLSQKSSPKSTILPLELDVHEEVPFDAMMCLDSEEYDKVLFYLIYKSVFELL